MLIHSIYSHSLLFVIDTAVTSGLTISLFIPPISVVHWFSGRVSGSQLLQLIHLGILVVFSSTAFHYFLWQVNHFTHHC